jgi:hypothetical protein
MIKFILIINVEHGDKIEKKKHEPVEHPEAKDHTPHHGHDNQVCLFLLNLKPN